MESILGIDLGVLVQAVGITGLFAIIFAESGLLIGFFLPGDSLLISAGILASQGFFNIWILVLVVFTAAVLGDSAGYALGKKLGAKIFNRPGSKLFNPDQVERARIFYIKHGPWTLVLARFLPFIRTIAPTMAGVGKMEYPKFLVYNVLGGLIWAVGLPLAGFWFGKVIPEIEKYAIPLVLVIIFVTSLPGIMRFFWSKENRTGAKRILNRLFKRIK